MQRPQFFGVVRGVAGAVALFGLAACNATTASVPDQPAYDLDVRPILMAHCARCHGAGDALNVPTEPTGPGAPPIPSVAGMPADTFNALNFYLDRYDNDGTKIGAKNASGSFATTVGPGAKPPPVLMPPAPAPKLTDWEADVLLAWAKNPICSNSDGTSDLCPNGPGM